MTRHFAGAQLGCLHLAGGKVDSWAGMQIRSGAADTCSIAVLEQAREILKPDVDCFSLMSWIQLDPRC